MRKPPITFFARNKNTFLFVIWFSMGNTTMIPSKAKMVVPKNRGKFDAGANEGLDDDEGSVSQKIKQNIIARPTNSRMLAIIERGDMYLRFL